MPEGDVVAENEVVTRCGLCNADYGLSTMVKTAVWIDQDGKENFALMALKPKVRQGFPKICPKAPDGRHEIIPNY